jgi:glutathione S-transferase
MKLIVTATCPFALRCIILIAYKQIDCEINPIDLHEKPTWFKEASPLGKVPLLIDQDKAIFESHVINDYLDEISQNSLYPSDPFLKAQYKSWIAFSGSLISDYFQLLTTDSNNELQHRLEHLTGNLFKMENEIKLLIENDDKLSMLDISLAPLFTRINLIEQYYPLNLLKDKPALKQWSKRLLATKVILESLPLNYEEKIISNILKKGSIAKGVIQKNI